MAGLHLDYIIIGLEPIAASDDDEVKGVAHNHEKPDKSMQTLQNPSKSKRNLSEKVNRIQFHGLNLRWSIKLY